LSKQAIPANEFQFRFFFILDQKRKWANAIARETVNPGFQHPQVFMTSAYGFDIGPRSQGAIFALSASARRNRRQTFGAWEAELRKDSDYVCVRGSVLNLQEPLADVIEAAHGVAGDLLDILAVEERVALLVIEPHNNLVSVNPKQG
jgi:hypothetical protein